jgi:hypothetical protein
MIALPLVVRAQESDMSATIRAALAGDPRTDGMTEAQISAMVSVLSQQAEKQGIAPSDIAWRPVSNTPASDAATCGSMPPFLCSINMAFGFAGSDHRIPWGLGISSLLLMFIIAALLERHHLHMRALRNTPPAQL